ncbi:hypothetical protein [Actinoplanes italicus]|uniref:hypothetical protein n=1 Tax=Actinoplanes italicus TaxID=113567 RepID=UPI000D06648E|nr:hypothetical protein [Actinoplanes italicus]
MDYYGSFQRTAIDEENLLARQPDVVTGLGPEQLTRQLEEELQRVRREWIPLMQFHVGSFYLGRFLIRVDDLTALQFDRAASWTEFTEQRPPAARRWCCGCSPTA